MQLADQPEETASSFSPAGLLRRWAGSLSIAGFFLCLAFRRAWLSTHDLKLPFDYDLFRDAAFAHSVMAGKFPADPYYLGEQNWYNPLSAFLIAGVAHLFSTDPIQVHARLGAFVGLIVPVAVFLFAIALFGRWSAVGTIFAFLFLHPLSMTCYVPTYSPWLWSNNLALVPMAACIALALRARTAAGDIPWIWCGAALGVTFLGHTAAAVLAGCIALAVGFTRDWLVTLRRYAVMLTVAFVASLPFALTILFHYKLRVVALEGTEFLSDETPLSHLPTLLLGSLTVANAVAGWGAVMLLRNRAMIGVRRALFTWLAVAGLLLAWGFFRQAVPNIRLPSIVPSFHWLFQLRLARALLFGFGLYNLSVMATTTANRWLRIPAPAAVCAVLLTVLAWNYHHFLEMFDFIPERAASLAYSDRPGFMGTILWLRANAPIDAVILTDPANAVLLIGAAYRHAVVIAVGFSNPYIRIDERAQTALTMNAALASADEPNFRAGACKYRVGYVLLTDVTSPADPRLVAPFTTVAYTEGTFTILSVKP